MIKFQCPNCLQKYSAEDEYIGEEVECPKCNTNIIVTPLEQSSQNCDNSNYDLSASVYVTCPHCYKRFDFREINYISRHIDLLGDSTLGSDAQTRFLPTKFSAKGLAIDAKGMECAEMACPNCHLKIPESVIELPTSIFSIIGAPSSGKSYLLTIMLWQIRKCLPRYFNFNFGDVDVTFNSVLNHYEHILFLNNNPDKPVSLPKTELQGSGYTNQILLNGFPVDLPKPFIFALLPMHSHPNFHKKNNNLERNVILYDNAGEHFQPGYETVSNLATQHLSHSDGLIFVFDPLRDTRMHNFCDRNDPQFQQETTNQLALFYEMTSRIRKFSGLQVTEKYKRPLIIVIAKFDVLQKALNLDINNDDFIYYDENQLEYHLNMQNITNVSFLLRQQLLSIAPELIGAAESFSDTVYYIPVSAFGCSPQTICHNESTNDDNSTTHGLGIVPSKINPFWAEVPFLLQLFLHGLITGVMPEPPNIEPLKNYKFSDETLIFSFPGTKERYEIPLLYCDTAVLCKSQNKYYKLPPNPYIANTTNQYQATRVDEQIDNDFWNN